MKKLLAVMLCFTLLLGLSGCGMPLLRKVYEEQTGETLPEGEIVTDTDYLLYEVTVTYADGSTSGTEYLYEDHLNKDKRPYKQVTGCIYYEDGEETAREEYTWDEQGNITAITPNWEGSEPQTFEFTYDENGRIATETAYINGELNYTAVNTYDEDGNLILRESHTDSVYRIEYTYDDQNRLIETQDYDANGDPLFRTVTEYADNGRVHKITVYDTDGNVTYYEEHTHEGSYETILKYKGDGTLMRRLENTYSYANIVAKEDAYEADGTLISTTVWHYVPSSYSYIEYE